MIVGDPVRLADDDVAAFRPERHLDGVCQPVDPAQNRLSRRIAVRNAFCHDLLLLAAIVAGAVGTIRTCPDRSQHLVFFHDQVVDAVKRDLLTGVFAE